MGGNQSYEFDQELFHRQWERKQTSYQNGRSLWRNISQPSVQIQEYPIYADTEQDIERQRQLFSLRRNSSQLVAATHLKETVKGGLCSSAAQGRLYLQRIPLKLQALQHIPFPDILHLHFNALTGYKKLFKAVGAFRPQNEQIGFNNAGQAKVWLNSDFSSSNYISKQTSQFAMARNLLQIIQDATDNNSTPRQNPSIFNFIYRNRNDVTFDQALTSIREYANQYNGGLIPKNLQCIQSIGIENISRSLFSGREESFNQNNFQSQRSSVTNVVVPPQQTTVVNGGFVQQRQSIVGGSTVNPVLYQSRSLQPTGPVLTQPVQGQIIQQILPPQIPLQQVPIQQVPIQQVPVQNPIQQRFIQSQVQTVRPVQPAQQILFRAPQQQRVIQQIIRQPQSSRQMIPQPPQIISQLPQVISQQPQPISQPPQIISQQPVIINQGSRILAPQSYQNQIINQVIPTQVSVQPQVQTSVQTTEPNKQSQVFALTKEVSTNQHESSNNETSQQRNVIDSNTMSIGIGSGAAQYQSYNSSAEKYGSYGSRFDSETQNIGFVADQASSRYKDINLEDGKSSQTLLAQLKGFSSSKKNIASDFNTYNFSSSSYSNTYQFTQPSNQYTNFATDPYTNFTTDYTSTSKPYTYQPQPSTQPQSGDIYSTFSKYAKGGLQDNLEMKYSMTKNLYEQPSTSYQVQSSQENNVFENNQYEYSRDLENYQQDGEYHVDYDPEILADIQRLKN